MADGTSAELFGDVFKYLAKQPEGKERDRFVRKMWNMAAGFDFSWDQMSADRALIKLGLARRQVDPEYPDDGLVLVYKGDSLW